MTVTVVEANGAPVAVAGVEPNGAPVGVTVVEPNGGPVAVTVNGVAVQVQSATPALAAARELLRQRAVVVGLLGPAQQDAAEIDRAIECLLEREVTVPTPTEAECRRHYETHGGDFRSGELACVRHILFQVTNAVNVPAIRGRAEATLTELLNDPARFEQRARELSNCPSGQSGGNLGQIGRGDTVPEFEQAVFGGPTGVLRELVRTRHGFHIVAVDRRIEGQVLPFAAVRDRIAQSLVATVEQRALGQYVSVLAGQAQIDGVDLNAAATPLVQ